MTKMGEQHGGAMVHTNAKWCEPSLFCRWSGVRDVRSCARSTTVLHVVRTTRTIDATTNVNQSIVLFATQLQLSPCLPCHSWDLSWALRRSLSRFGAERMYNKRWHFCPLFFRVERQIDDCACVFCRTRRWFALNGKTLSYAAKPHDKHKGQIIMTECTECRDSTHPGARPLFCLTL